MIPAILAAPVVEGVLGQIVGMLSPQTSAPASSSSSSSSFTPHLNKAAAGLTMPATPASGSAPSGTLTSAGWNQMSPTDLQSWMKGLAGRHVHATDVSGRTFSGIVDVSPQTGGVPSLSIGGHLVSLSQLNQVSWSPSVA